MGKGSVLNKKYRVIKKIEGKSNVFLVEHIYLHTLWVIKKWTSCLCSSMPAEPLLLARLNHRSIPMVVDYFVEDGNQYMVEEFLEGDTVEAIVRARGKVPNKKSLEWMYELCKVLRYIHDLKPFPIIHGDIKPSNMLVSSDGDIKLIDFGASKCKVVDVDIRCFGTEGYAAPEQGIPSEIDHRTDIYGMGGVFYYILTGQHPKKTFHIDSNTSLSENVSYVIDKCTSSSKESRYANVRELEKDIYALLYCEGAGKQRYSK